MSHRCIIGSDNTDIVAVMSNRTCGCAACHAEAMDKTAADMTKPPVPFDDSNFQNILFQVDQCLAPGDGKSLHQMFGNDFSRQNTNDGRVAVARRDVESTGCDRFKSDAVQPDRCNSPPAGKGSVVRKYATGKHLFDAASLEIVQQNDIGAFSRCDYAAVLQTECVGRRPAGGPIGIKRTDALCNQAPDHAVEMAFFCNIERVAVVRTKSDERGNIRCQDRSKGFQVL